MNKVHFNFGEEDAFADHVQLDCPENSNEAKISWRLGEQKGEFVIRSESKIYWEYHDEVP